MTGQELKARRKSLGKTQAELAAQLGVSQELIAEMETGVKPVLDWVTEKLGKGMYNK